MEESMLGPPGDRLRQAMHAFVQDVSGNRITLLFGIHPSVSCDILSPGPDSNGGLQGGGAQHCCAHGAHSHGGA